MKKLILRNYLACGDNLVLTAAIYSLHRQFPNQYKTAIDSSCPLVYQNNPDIVQADDTFEKLETHYPSINQCGDISNSFLNGYIDFLKSHTHPGLALQTNRPHLYLTEEEEKKYKELGKYWIIICGHKLDFTAKALSKTYLQQVVDHFIGKIHFIQPVLIAPNHQHYPLNNTKIISKLSQRDMFSLAFNSSGIVGPVTCWKHIAAAFKKPYICIAGGREGHTWIANYGTEHIIHSVGMLDCCKERGCWKNKVELGDDPKDKSLCKYPIFYNGQWLAKCILNIKPEEIISILERNL